MAVFGMFKHRNIIESIDKKLDNLHQGVATEMNKQLFPQGRERAMEDLDERIHRFTFGRSKDD